MAAADRPQITLITPPLLDLESFPAQLATVMDAVAIACLRLALATRDEDAIARAAAPIFSPICGRTRMKAGGVILGLSMRKPPDTPAPAP